MVYQCDAESDALVTALSKVGVGTYSPEFGASLLGFLDTANVLDKFGH